MANKTKNRAKSITKKNSALPSKFKANQLPFFELVEANFEELCRRLCVKEFPDYERHELKRKKGNAQFGVDVECFNSAGDPETVLSAKCYDRAKATPASITTWVDDFVDELDKHWKGKNVKTFILAVTKDGNQDAINERLKEQKSRLKKLGIELIPWFNSKLHDLTSPHRDLVIDFWDQAWAVRIFDDPINAQNLTVSNRSDVGAEGKALSGRAFNQLLDKLDKTTVDYLELHVQARRDGNSKPLREFLNENVPDFDNWNSFSNSLKARIMRLKTSVEIGDQNIEKAKQFLETAKDLAPLPDQVLPALIANQEGCADDALNVLGAGRTGPEMELRAALLIENRNLTEAKEVLASMEISAEGFRLQSIVACLEGELEDAIFLGNESLKLSRQSFGASLSLMVAHLHSALTPNLIVGVGSALNPFNPNFVLSTASAKQHLEKANTIADQLLSRTTGEVLADVETWKLALLLCSKDRHEDAFNFAKKLVGRTDPNPLHIAWAFMANVKLQTGRVRRSLENAIRSGRGTSTHVVVTAMLAQNSDEDSKKGATVIEKYKKYFPLQEGFLEQWKERLSGKDSEQRRRISAGDKNAIEGLDNELNTHPDNIETYLVHAELLNDARAWPNIVVLKDKLLSYNLPRLHELVARATFETEAYDDAINIANDAKRLFDKNELPLQFANLHATALDRSGKEGDAIEALLELDRRQPHATTKRELSERYFRLGRLDDAVRFARLLVDADGVETQDYLFAAHVSQNIDPDFSRLASENYITSDDFNIDAVPHLMEIQQRVGKFSNDTQLRFNEVTSKFFETSSSVRRFDDIEEVLSEIRRISDKTRTHRTDWEAGKSTSHRAFHTDFRTFIKLFLADRRDIISEINDTHFPLVATAGFNKIVPEIDSISKPILVLDVSAILIAHRFNLFEHLECLFQLRVPRCASNFLSEAQKYSNTGVSNSDRIKFRQFERENLKQVEICNVVPSGRRVVHRTEVDENRPSELKWLLSELESGGQLSDAEYSDLIAELGIQNVVTLDGGEPVKTLYIDSTFLLLLLRQGLFEVAAGIVQFSIAKQELEHLRDEVLRSDRLDSLDASVKQLAQIVSKKLIDKVWTTIPSPPRIGMTQEELKPAETSNALLTSIWEVVNYSQCIDKPLVWIEDRYLNRHNLKNMLSLGDIVTLLKKHETIPSNQLALLQSEIQECDFGLNSLSVEDVLMALKQAKVKDGLIIETTQLKKIRRAFGVQAKYLSKIDWTDNQTDADGRLIGEMRHARDLGFLLPEILKSLWFIEGGEFVRLAAISDWLWSNLRLEAVRFMDTSEPQDISLALSSVFFMDCATLPFFYALQNNFEVLDNYKGYTRWLFGRQLSARLSVDKKLKAAFVQQFTSLFNAQFEKEIGTNEEDAEIVHKLFAREINRLLDLFPDNIREEILENDQLSDRIFKKRDFLFHTPEGDFYVTDISLAIATALTSESGQCKINKGNDDQKAFLKAVEISGNKLRVEITVGKKIFPLADYSVMLSAPTAKQRLTAFSEINDFKKRSPVFVSLAHEILSREQSVVERIKLWNKHRRSDFSDHLQEIEHQLDTKSAVDHGLVYLPSASVLLEFSQLPADAENVSEALNAAIKSLIKFSDYSTAHDRLSAVEVLSGSFSHPSLREWAPQESANIIDQILSHLSNKTNLGCLTPECMTNDSKKFNDYLSLFSHFVQKGGHSALVMEGYAKLPPWLTVALIWVWAAQITNMLMAHRVNVVEAIDHLTSRDIRRLDQMLHSDGVDPVILIGTIDLNARQLKNQIFSLLVRNRVDPLDFDEHENLLELIGDKRENGWVPHANLMFANSPENWPFATLPSFSSWKERGLITLTDTLQHFGEETIVSEIMTQVANDNDAVTHLSMFLLCPTHSLGDEQRTSVQAELKKRLLLSRNRDLLKGELVLLRLTGQLTGESGQTDKFKDFAAEMIVQRFGADIPTPIPVFDKYDGSASLFELLVDAAFAHVQKLDLSFFGKITSLVDLLAHLSAQWPNSSPAMQQLLNTLIDLTPTELSAPFWSLLADLRYAAADNRNQARI